MNGLHCELCLESNSEPRIQGKADRKQRGTDQEDRRALILSKAKLFLDTGSQHDANHPILLFLYGYEAAVEKKFEAAKTYYEKALQAEPIFPRARNNLGFVYAKQRRFDDAIAQFAEVLNNKAAPLASQHLWHWNLGSAYLEQGAVDKACAEWDNAALIPPKQADWESYYRAVCYAAKGMQPEAEREFRQAVELVKNNRKMDLTDSKVVVQLDMGPKEGVIVNALVASVTASAKE